MAAGAVAGAAAGLYLGHRYRSMDAFLDDVRGRVSALRDIWYDDELADESRLRVGADLEDDLDDDEVEDEDDEAEEELDEDEVERSPYADADDFEEEDEDVAFDEDEEDGVDEFEEDLASVTGENGASQASVTREEAARQLEERVLRALRDEPVLSARAIEIAVVGDGVVELTGTVRAIEEVSRASALARNIKGVSMVLNRIDVRMGGSIDTASVARDRVDASPEDRASE
jgi:osmotically-inducible protein OsmY